ncbi:hypothetical protein DPX16_19518 [Anabarilius grahami]|uniref:Uncharacterized protein n=1 Tax=Anabarilius grahami TaxID=495550 RepID=A0A3N0Y7T8_ANAGA|nr:hypothetical protein DPX16_19518 [Anabarilius grahami]
MPVETEEEVGVTDSPPADLHTGRTLSAQLTFSFTHPDHKDTRTGNTKRGTTLRRYGPEDYCQALAHSNLLHWWRMHSGELRHEAPTEAAPSPSVGDIIGYLAEVSVPQQQLSERLVASQTHIAEELVRLQAETTVRTTPLER